jgi:hypothetical protein
MTILEEENGFKNYLFRIINAVKNISTPVITVSLANEKDEKLARRVKVRIEKTTLGG